MKRLLDKEGRLLYDPRAAYRERYRELMSISPEMRRFYLGAYAKTILEADPSEVVRRLNASVDRTLPGRLRRGLTTDDRTFLSDLKIRWEGDER